LKSTSDLCTDTGWNVFGPQPLVTFVKFIISWKDMKFDQKKNPLVSMRAWAEDQMCTDWGESTPLGASGIFTNVTDAILCSIPIFSRYSRLTISISQGFTFYLSSSRIHRWTIRLVLYWKTIPTISIVLILVIFSKDSNTRDLLHTYH
jgi:hypothetical protein